ncbi:MAG TPA: HAD family hydrolase [Acidimicrobiia bacterium]|nr:HAD family hydrolase [Acidimicrobiia bacterium]
MHEAPRQGERVVAAFDFDKTISTRDNVVPFVRAVVGRTRLTHALLAISPRLVGAALDDERRDAAKVALVRRTFAGYDAGLIARVAAEFADDVVARHLRPDVVERVAWHRNQGHELVIVSASFTSYLDPIAARLGFAAVLATELAVGVDGRLTGELVRPNVRGAETVRRLDEGLGATASDARPVFVWAYGDSSGDRELLARADQGVRVGGRPGRG